MAVVVVVVIASLPLPKTIVEHAYRKTAEKRRSEKHAGYAWLCRNVVVARCKDKLRRKKQQYVQDKQWRQKAKINAGIKGNSWNAKKHCCCCSKGHSRAKRPADSVPARRSNGTRIRKQRALWFVWRGTDHEDEPKMNIVNCWQRCKSPYWNWKMRWNYEDDPNWMSWPTDRIVARFKTSWCWTAFELRQYCRLSFQHNLDSWWDDRVRKRKTIKQWKWIGRTGSRAIVRERDFALIACAESRPKSRLRGWLDPLPLLFSWATIASLFPDGRGNTKKEKKRKRYMNEWMNKRWKEVAIQINQCIDESYVYWFLRKRQPKTANVRNLE